MAAKIAAKPADLILKDAFRPIENIFFFFSFLEVRTCVRAYMVATPLDA